MKRNTKGSLILILCSFVWGMAFSGQSTAMRYIEPFTFVFLRSIITSAVLFLAYPLFKKTNANSNRPQESVKSHWILGGLLGLILVAAVSLQQVGIVYTTAAKSGFITALYIVIIPILGIFMGKKIGKLVWIGVAIALIGLFLLCMQSDLSVNVGDLLTLACAFIFSFHIILVDKYAGNMNSVLLSAIQFSVCALISFFIMVAVETPKIENMLACWTSIFYVAVFSGAIGYTLQFVGQKYTEPTLASLIMCLESVFAAIGGWILLGQGLSPRELLGCVLMLCATVIAQIPSGEKCAIKANDGI